MAKGWGSIYKGCEAYWPAGQDGVETPQQAPSPGTPQALVSVPPHCIPRPPILVETSLRPHPHHWSLPCAEGPRGLT